METVCEQLYGWLSCSETCQMLLLANKSSLRDDSSRGLAQAELGKY